MSPAPVVDRTGRQTEPLPNLGGPYELIHVDPPDHHRATWAPKDERRVRCSSLRTTSRPPPGRQDGGVRSGDLVGRARAAVATPGADPALHGLSRLAGGMTHHVFAPLDDSNVVIKVFQTTSRDEPEHEWDALVTLAGSGIAPEPVHFDAGDPAVVVMTRVSGSSLPAGSIGAEHARQIGRVHRLVHRMVPEVRRPPSHSGARAARTALMLDDRHESSSVSVDASDVVARAWRAAQVWIAGADLERLLYSDSLSFSRGDPNLSNYLWSEKALSVMRHR